MRIAAILFTYNRSDKTAQVLEALSKNSRLPEKIYIFQDGLKNKGDREEWLKVNALINSVDWCNAEIIVSGKNKGLASFIMDGVERIFKEYDGIIVLEDDCVPEKHFISFMTQCLEKYEQDSKVYSISGYSWPITLPGNGYDVYACGRISSWGWGTWKDRWGKYRQDYAFTRKMRREKEASRRLAAWGKDLEDILIANIKGTADSWAVFWALTVIAEDGICINPYRSLIKNIGFDGTGVHCGITEKFQVDIDERENDNFNLPDILRIPPSVEFGFASLYGSYTAASGNEPKHKKVLIYGLGRLFLQNEKWVNDNFYIEAFIDKRKEGWFAGKKIIKPCEIDEFCYDGIIIMIQNRDECERVWDMLVKQYGIEGSFIRIGMDLLDNTPVTK